MRPFSSIKPNRSVGRSDLQPAEDGKTELKQKYRIGQANGPNGDGRSPNHLSVVVSEVEPTVPLKPANKKPVVLDDVSPIPVVNNGKIQALSTRPVAVRTDRMKAFDEFAKVERKMERSRARAEKAQYRGPSIRNNSYDGQPLLTKRERRLASRIGSLEPPPYEVCVPTQINGHQGEETGSDDLADTNRGGRRHRPKPGFGMRMAQRDNQLVVRTLGAPNDGETLDVSGENATIAEPNPHKAAVRDWIANEPAVHIVYNRRNSCHALVDFVEHSINFGGATLLNKLTGKLLDNSPSCVLHDGSDPKQLGRVSGYTCVHKGHYARIDYSDCKTVEDCELLREQHSYQLENCGERVMLDPFHFHSNGQVVHTQAQYVYCIDALYMHGRSICRGKTTDSQFDGLRANLARRFKGVSDMNIHNAAVRITYDLIHMALLKNNDTVKVGCALAINSPQLFEQVRNTLGLGGFYEGGAVARSEMTSFDMCKIPYTNYVESRAVPGFRYGGELLDGWTLTGTPGARGFVIPTGSHRFRVHDVRGRVDFLDQLPLKYGIFTDVPSVAESRMPYFTVSAQLEELARGDEPEVGYTTAGFIVRGTMPESHRVVLQENSFAFSDALFKRALIAVPNEDALYKNQMLVLFHIKDQCPELFDVMFEGLALGNAASETAVFLSDLDEFEDEVGAIRQFTDGSFYQGGMDLDDELLAKLMRSGAATSMVACYRRVQGHAARDEWNTRYVMGSFCFVLGIFCIYLTELFTSGLVHYTMMGTILLAGSIAGGIKCYEYVSTGGARYSVDSSGMTWKWLSNPLYGSALYTSWLSVSRPHIKRLLYINTLLKRLRMGFWDFSPEFAVVHNEPANVIFKKHEGSKYGKAARFIVSCGWVTIATQIAASYVKGLLSEAYDLGAVLRTSFSFPIPDLWYTCLSTLPLSVNVGSPNSLGFCYSDDEWAMLILDGRRFFIEADASNADATVHAPILLGMLPALYRAAGSKIPFATIVVNFVRTWLVVNPERKSDHFSLTAYNANMASGDSNTTAIQGIFSSMRFAAFYTGLCAVLHMAVVIRQRDAGLPPQTATTAREADALRAANRRGNGNLSELIDRMVILGAQSVGGISTVGVFDKPQDTSLLKRTIMCDTTGKPVYLLCLGAILTSFGTYGGDISHAVLGLSPAAFAALDVRARWDMFVRGVVAGLVHEPASPIVTALRQRFPGGRVLTHSNVDEKFKYELGLSGGDNSQCVIPVEEFVERYGCTVAEWNDFADCLRNIQYGDVLEHKVMDYIRHKDYGTPKPL